MNPGLRIFPARSGNAAAPRRFPSFARLAAVLGVVLLAACAGTDEDEYAERPVESLYNEAMDALEVQDYRAAAPLFDEVERQHPYSTWATRAQLMAAYAYYQHNDYDDAIVALDRFIQLHPSNRDVPYAYYLKGLSYYEQISDVSRDQKMKEYALKSVNQLVSRYPESKFARAA